MRMACKVADRSERGSTGILVAFWTFFISVTGIKFPIWTEDKIRPAYRASLVTGLIWRGPKCLSAVLVSQRIVGKCTAAILFCTVNSVVRLSRNLPLENLFPCAVFFLKKEMLCVKENYFVSTRNHFPRFRLSVDRSSTLGANKNCNLISIIIKTELSCLIHVG